MKSNEIEFDTSWPEELKNTRLGIIRAEVACKASGAGLIEEIKKEEKSVKEKFKLYEINQIPAIVDARKAYKLAGNDPNRYRPSADSLLRRIVKGQDLYLINNIVDSLNLVSIRTGFSIGAYDERALNGRIFFGLGIKDEEYNGIGRGKLNITNLPVLRDDIGAFGSPTSDSTRTMVTDCTTHVTLVFFDFGHNSLLDDALIMMRDQLQTHCKAGDMTCLTIDID